MWANLLIGLVLNYVSYLLTPKPQAPTPAEDIDGVPRASEGDPIMVDYGSPWNLSPQVAWYGDFSSEAIKQ